MAAGLTTPAFADDHAVMQRALLLARRGTGRVEPNPAVGAVIVDSQRRLLGEGWHEQYGAPHAEVMALRQAGPLAAGATLFVTLEPCAHHGKTPPCSQAVIAAGIRRVVAAVSDPAGHNAGRGFAELRAAGIDVDVGLCGAEAEELIAPFTMLFTQRRPYVHAKWAMTLDGKLATRTGSSKWISNVRSRAVVHALRGRMDAILTGIGTVLADDPLLTARPPGLRTPARIILDARLRLPVTSQLIQTIASAPVVVVTTPAADRFRRDALRDAGAEVLEIPSPDETEINLRSLLHVFGQRRYTNLLVEGGNRVLGSFWDLCLVDEVHAFVAPKLVGGTGGVSPVGGHGLAEMPQQSNLIAPHIEILDDNVYIHGRVQAQPVS